jgi:hypothetical protein
VQCEDQFRREKHLDVPFFNFSSQLFISSPVFLFFGGENWGLKATSLVYFMHALLILISNLNPTINHKDCHGSLIMHLWGYFGHWIRTPNFGNKQSYQVAERLLNLGPLGLLFCTPDQRPWNPGVKWHFTLVAWIWPIGHTLKEINYSSWFKTPGLSRYNST